MKVVIFGATGFTGKAILPEALARQHQVTVLVRNPQSVTVTHPLLTVIKGDVLDRATVRQVLAGQEAVIQCLGIGGKGLGQPNTFISDATRILVEEMEQAGVSRLVALSNVGVGNSRAFHPWVFRRIILPYFMKWLQAIIEDKNRMEPMMMQSSLNWTLVRCPNITPKPSDEKVKPTLDGQGLRLSVSNDGMARFVVEQLTSPNFSRQAPSISH